MVNTDGAVLREHIQSHNERNNRCFKTNSFVLSECRRIFYIGRFFST
jgi:hypothetical protein